MARLEGLRRAGRLRVDFHIMSANGGGATAEMAADRPIIILLPSPAAGVLGGIWAGALSGRDNLILFDIGGTSIDIGIVTTGAVMASPSSARPMPYTPTC